MDPITKAIDKTQDLLGHSPHPAIVALPLGAWAVTAICDGLAAASGRRAYDDAARISLAVGLVGAAGAALTGLRDYGKIPPDREPNHEIATTHGLGNAVVGTLMATSYLLRELDHQAGRAARPSARLIGLAGAGLSVYTAWLGGRLVEELGEAVEPSARLPRGRTPFDDEDRGRERLAPGSPLGRSSSSG